MNFKEFYHNTEQRLTDAILSLWATSDQQMQEYLKYIFQQEKEKLLAEPVFQTTFPWKPANQQFGDLTGIFDANFIDALDKIKNAEYRFPKERKPYQHQVESWDELINKKKSIAVTTGTGSGKTECFMLPVLYDIYQNARNQRGVNAIFLYPLNALIGSQKKRVHAWSHAIGGVNYGVYNGKTDENAATKAQNDAYPEIISRELIRKNPPQILFTNPTMLEYILVRRADAELLKNSQGTLRWILLDEAHTLTGSAAAEMAMLIRRVLDAFGVTINDVRFAITSATVGNDNDADLKRFMSNLCGISENSIEVIKGNRILPEIPAATIPTCTFDELKTSPDIAQFESVQALRKKILDSKGNALKVADIAQPFNVQGVENQLEVVDILSGTLINKESLFPVRGHFFARGIGGTYVCTNPSCTKHARKTPIGTISTIVDKECNHCHFPMMELVACRSCSNYMLQGEEFEQNDAQYVRLSSAVAHDAFLMDNNDDDDTGEDNDSNGNGQMLFVAKYDEIKRYVNPDHLINVSFLQDGKIDDKRSFVRANINGQSVCPHCGEPTNNPMHFRLSASFMNRNLSDIVLEQAQQDKSIERQMLWEGRKYISFTDSRQGTAKTSALINIDNESNWVRSQVFHLLAQKRRNAIASANPDYIGLTTEDLKDDLNNLSREIMEEALAIKRQRIQREINDLQEEINRRDGDSSPAASESRMTWVELLDALNTKSELQTLYDTAKRGESEEERRVYLRSLFFDQFARRLPRERSLENLGLVNIVYADLDNVSTPPIATTLGINKQEWQSLLKIGLDYIIRSRFHFIVPPELKKFSTSKLKSFPIYPADSRTGVESWPKFNRGRMSPNRLALLICAGLGWHSQADINSIQEEQINELLKEIWKVFIKLELLTLDNPSYKLNIEQKFSFELADELWLCPVKNRLIDRHFKGYSPWITGKLTPENISFFKVGQPITFPYFPHPFNQNDDNDINVNYTKQWIETNPQLKEFKAKGLWNNLHERIIQIKPLFLAGEHSAQLSDVRLGELENKFEKGELNILSCSTTMEMGVDIGGISAVVMNNVPPSSSNYLQRAGRAGRRMEPKSLALTFCAASPIGANAMDNPLWALTHPIAPPMLAFNSPSLVERHINAFFLGKFIQTIGGVSITEKLDDFFFNDAEGSPIVNRFLNFLNDDNFDFTRYEGALKHLIDKTPFFDKTSFHLLKIVISNFEKLWEKTRSKKEGYESSLAKLAEQFGDNSPAYRAVNYQFGQFRYQNVIGYLANEGFIPSAGIPTGVISLETVSLAEVKRFAKLTIAQRREEVSNYKRNPTYHITRALTEFAPGNNIVIDGRNYVSAGITLKSDRGNQAKKDIIQSCTSCGYQRIVEVQYQQYIDDKCPHCQNNKLKGLKLADGRPEGTFTELIEPAGFATNLYEESSRKISEKSNAQHVEPLLIGVQPWTNDENSIYDVRESEENGEILYYNMGRGNNGFTVCLHCGRADFSAEEVNKPHKRLRGGRNDTGSNECGGTVANGIKQNVILGGRFKTDYCEIRFKEQDGNYSNDESTLLSLGVVLTKTFASFLGIEEDELGFGVKKYQNHRSLFIFDNAKGGAGYSVKFSYHAEDIFKAAINKLYCACEKACTKCLIDRSSQWYLHKLDRKLAIDWLQRAVTQTVPADLGALIPNLRSVLGSIKEDVRRFKYRNDIAEIWLFADNNVGDWDLEKAVFINNLKESSLKINKESSLKINFVLDGAPNFGEDMQNHIITAIQMSSWSNFLTYRNTINGLKPVCQLRLKDGKFVVYYSRDFNNSLSEQWGISKDGNAYRDDTPLSFQSVALKIPQIPQNNLDVKINYSKSFSSRDLATIFLDANLENRGRLTELMRGKTFRITYSDRYLNSPLSCLLLVQFINGLKEALNFNIRSLELRLEKFGEDRGPKFIYHNYLNSIERDEALESMAARMDIDNVHIQPGNLPHYRFFKFDDGQGTLITIRPDGGIGHGWDCTNRDRSFNVEGDEGIDCIKKSRSHDILFTVIYG
ncbi:DEAD/DEAH box helicase [Runella sp.]|uniref:DEAD/DEAH box helicase n=1 Tax=Runella sp. TaxID=1960881 RepID=UPI00301B1474